MAPKVAPLAKQLSMKAIDAIRDKGINFVGNLAGKAFSAAKDKIASLVRKKPGMTSSVVLPSTTVMPAKISKVINNAVEEKLAQLTSSQLTTSPVTDSAIMNAIAGSGLKQKRNSKNFQRR
jgi:hypothetical protein